MKKQDKAQAKKKRDRTTEKVESFKDEPKRKPLTHNPFASVFKAASDVAPTQ